MNRRREKRRGSWNTCRWIFLAKKKWDYWICGDSLAASALKSECGGAMALNGPGRSALDERCASAREPRGRPGRRGVAGVGRPRGRESACAPGRGGRASWLSRARAELQASSGRGPCASSAAMGHLWLWGTCGLWGLLLSIAEPRAGNSVGAPGRQAREFGVDAPGVRGGAAPPGSCLGQG